MNFIDFSNIPAEILEIIIDNSLEVKNNSNAYGKLFEGKGLYMLFEKTSTRTAISFERAMVTMGGTAMIQRLEDTNFGICDIQDEVRYVGRNFDVITARMKNNADIKIMGEYSTVPIINGCCNKYHPCQAMADIMTIKELFGTFNVKMMYIGVWNNVFNSLVESLPKLGGKLYGCTPIMNKPAYDQKIVEAAMATGNFIQLDTNMPKENLKKLVQEMDVIYTDTWVDMEFFKNPSFAEKKEERLSKMMPFQINEELLEGSKAIIMHDMPMHPGYEISRETIEKHIDTILLQAENRTHAQKGILIEVMPGMVEKFEAT